MGRRSMYRRSEFAALGKRVRQGAAVQVLELSAQRYALCEPHHAHLVASGEFAVERAGDWRIWRRREVPREPLLELVAGGLVVAAHLPLDRWVRLGSWSHLLAAAAVFLLAASVHAGRYIGFGYRPLHAGAYFMVGMMGICCGASALTMLPAYVAGDRLPSTAVHLALVRAVVLGAAAAAAYFGRAFG